ncbi:NAD(P)/FAD-dependent oxidoreductase [Desmonostoc muscorum LEGE 12446]|uniref:demethylphylloquinone reductase n=1 Tax=Desmonostoc muscorum LEGE 12446 TaxID=1828758 RepID=A0A8J7D2M7_DESMC|nr:NAD(P)/FAD-dependent oxidoreductase [Desmonostoc muscorum]MCF2145586.1 NAD(P)/FAD-dependent oxidoreductase [Desmonostoc muscorum LEGE 12446]
MTQQTSRICILGGGFGGLYTALGLSQLPWESTQKPEIVLVDQSDRFLFSPFLYELLTGELQTWEIAPPFEELLQGTGVRFYQGVVSGIDIDQRRVNLHEGPQIPYDRLVLALGGETPLDLVPGAADHAYPFRTISDAYRLEERLRFLEESDADKIRVAIVGAGYSGVELACKLADRLGERGRFRLVEIADQILRTSPEFNREAAKKALDARGIFLDLETKVESIGQDTISLEYKNQVDTIPVELVIWTVGTRVAPVVKSLPLKQNQRGQISTTSNLQVFEHPEIFALGDLADSHDAEGQQVPATAQAAFQQADYAAWNIWASLTNRPLLPFRYQHLGEMMALGKDNATLAGLGIKLEGPLAYIGRRLAYLYRLPTLDHQLKVGFNWLVRPIIETLSK